MDYPRGIVSDQMKWSRSKLFDTLIVFPNEVFEKRKFGKKYQQTTNKSAKLPSIQSDIAINTRAPLKDNNQ